MADTDKTGLLSRINALEALLEKQIEFARRGSVIGIESMGKQMNSLVEEIACETHLESAAFAGRQKRLKCLFDELCMAIAAQKAEVSEEISRIRKGRKTINTYRNSI